MTAWEAFIANQRKLAGKEAIPKLVCTDLQPYQTVQACDRADIMNIGVTPCWLRSAAAVLPGKVLQHQVHP